VWSLLTAPSSYVLQHVSFNSLYRVSKLFLLQKKRLLVAIYWNSKRTAKKWPYSLHETLLLSALFGPILKMDTMLCLQKVKKVKCFHS